MIFWHSRARGEQGFVLFWRHGLRNVALPAITLQFAAFSELFGGAVLTEQVFSYPGLGQATVEAGLRGDVPRCRHHHEVPGKQTAGIKEHI